MASKRPGIMVRLDQEDYELVKRAAAAARMSMGGLLGEYVEMSRPMLQHVVGLAEALDQADEDRRSVHLEAVEGAMAKGQAMADLAEGQLSMVYDMLETATGAVKETNIQLPRTEENMVASGVGGRSDPPSNNMGVRSQKTPLITKKLKKQQSEK